MSQQFWEIYGFVCHVNAGDNHQVVVHLQFATTSYELRNNKQYTKAQWIFFFEFSYEFVKKSTPEMYIVHIVIYDDQVT